MQQPFTFPDWAKSTNIYEVNLRQYTPEGTFAAFEAALPRLKDMGVEILWFMPITPISKTKRLGSLGSYYAAADYTSTNPEFGTVDHFKHLVAEAHRLGFKVIIDWVANHTGWDHHWTQTNPAFYKKDATGNFFDAHGWHDVIDLDYTNEALRIAMLYAMEFWLKECNIDGYRCDMAHLVPLDFWQAARTHLGTVKKELFWLAETEDVVYHLAFDATYAWELLHTMEAIVKGTVGLPQLEAVLHKYDERFPAGAVHAAFTSNHDENSHSGSEYERLGEAAKAFAVLTATWKNCMPLVYSGQELPNKKRLKFFEKDEIEWTGTNWLHGFYKNLFSLRRSCTSLQVGHRGSTCKRIKTSADENVFAYRLQSETDCVLVMLNLSGLPKANITLAAEKVTGTYHSAFSGIPYQFTSETTFELNAWEYLVLYRQL